MKVKVTLIVLGLLLSTNALAKGLEDALDWKIETSKEKFFPGEPVLITLNISNNGNQEIIMNFGSDGIGAFSVEILDSSNKVVAQRSKLQRGGVSELGILTIPPRGTNHKSIILNQWCSTLLPIGKYHVIYHIEPFILMETHKAYYLPAVVQELDIQLINFDNTKFKIILNELVSIASKKYSNTVEEIVNPKIAREMLALTESVIAIPYQLELLNDVQSFKLKLNIINTLAKTENLDAANGLIKFFEDPTAYKDDVKLQLIDAIYRLRESGKKDILNATKDFVAKYKRPDRIPEPKD